MAYIVYKWQGHGHHEMKIPRIDAVKGLKGLVLSYVDKSEWGYVVTLSVDAVTPSRGLGPA